MTKDGLASTDKKILQNGKKENDSTPNMVVKHVPLKNHITGKVVFDTLHKQAVQDVGCGSQACYGSIWVNNASTKYRSRDILLKEAKDFMDQYYRSLKRYGTKAYETRLSQIRNEVEISGTYNMTETEIVFGAKLAWRNAQRCIGRIQWNKLQVFDARYVGTAQGMFEAICNHIRYATNKGNLRSAITVFPPRVEGRSDFRIWNSQLIGYAGYLQPDGTYIGDPVNAELTEVCQKLGWTGKGTRFDLLPLVLQGPDGEAKLFQIPEELVLEVPIVHPEFDWFAELGLKWYALPAVTGMKFDCGGLEYTAVPFSGWYVVTEIGSRDLGDPHRYNQLEVVATRMGLDTRSNASLWKDKAVTELNLAVLHSYQKCGVTIVDHHTATDTFMKHMDTEFRVRGGCPGDWVWLVPPVSGSSCPVFHQEFLNYKLKPAYDYQEPAWKTYDWRKCSLNMNGVSRKFRFKEIARAVKFTSKLFGQVLSRRIKATILYATETGKSATFASKLAEIFSHAFHPQVTCMADYDLAEIEHENIVLVVASTFGNGDPPENGEKFARELLEMKYGLTHEIEETFEKQKNTRTLLKMNSVEPKSQVFERLCSVASVTSVTSDMTTEDPPLPLSNVRFSVFALGSSAYPNFCAFGKCIDALFGDLGAERLLNVVCGDELSGQEQAFKEWAVKTYQLACETFCIDGGLSEKDISMRLRTAQKDESSVRFVHKDIQTDLCSRLSFTHSRKVVPLRLKSNDNLLPKQSELLTLNVSLTWNELELKEPINFSPGDHVGIYATNRKEIVDAVLRKLKNCPERNQTIQVQILEEIPTIAGPKHVWSPHPKLPCATIAEFFYNFLDITTPPTQQLLTVFAQRASNEKEKKRLLSLATNTAEYDAWKYWKWPHLLEVLEEFPSVSIDAALLVSLLPMLQPRFYSISSSRVYFPNEVQLTVGVLQFNAQGDNGPKHYGVCSNYLLNAQIGDIIPAFFRSESRFHLPEDGRLPTIMVGPGTGIAPFRAFWQEKLAMSKKETQGELLLLFGCRTKQMDLYHDEKEYMIRKGILTLLPVALSREPTVKKTYVQDRLLEEKHARHVYDLLAKKRGHIYVCGDCTMAEAVSKVLRIVFQRIGHMTQSEADEYFMKLQDEGRYHEDIFGITHRAAEVHSKSHESARIQMEQNSEL